MPSFINIPTTPAPRGDFAAIGIYDSHSLFMLNDGFRAVSAVPNGWNILARKDVPGTRDCGYCSANVERRPSCHICDGSGIVESSFMFDTHSDPVVKSTIDQINALLDGGHSGSSYGWTMRNMESVAKNGWDIYVAKSRVSRAKSMLEDMRYDDPRRQALVELLPVLKQKLEVLKNPPPVANVLAAAATVDTFIANNRDSVSNLSQFATAIQNDAGMRAMIPDIDEQAAALQRFAAGKMSYAEMRSLCG